MSNIDASKPGKVTVAGKDGADVPTGTLDNVVYERGDDGGQAPATRSCEGPMQMHLVLQ